MTAETGIQLHLPTFSGYSLAELLTLAEAAEAGGCSQIWVTDNLQHRSYAVMLAALAARVPIKLGTAILVQYFRNPVEVAGVLATVSELMDGRELSIGIARGNQNTHHFVHTPKPISTLRETAQCLRALLSGATVHFRDYPALGDYFNLVPDAPYELEVTPCTPVQLYCGGNGPLSIAVGGQYMDGIIFGSTVLVAARTGRLQPLLDVANEAASQAEPGKSLRRVAEIKISIAADGTAAREFVKPSVGSRVLGFRRRGYTDEDFRTLGIEPADVDRLGAARESGVARDGVSAYVTDAMIDAIFVAGDPAFCKEAMAKVCELTRQHGFHQIMFSELGPDAPEAMRLLTKEILPIVQ
jgi:alkanesulfonate monooxygenase SsuD/methylene tetrahydromethanopterin reductase-like flavin-dependent oxidoreductase (luciferase family)